MQKAASSHLMRHINRSGVLDLIREHQQISRSEIAKELHMSIPTVMRIVDDLLEQNLVRDLDDTQSSGGRPRQMLEYNSGSYAVLCLDLGGDRMKIVLTDLSGTVLIQSTHPIIAGEGEKNRNALINEIDYVLRHPLPDGQRLRGIGIGCPGMIANETGLVHYAPGLGWYDLDLAGLLSTRYQLPVYVENDVNLAALGEAASGLGRGLQNMVYISLGSAVGAGLILNGSLYRGFHKAAGEIGYFFPSVTDLSHSVQNDAPLNALISEKAILDIARRAYQVSEPDRETGDITIRQIFEFAANHTPWAEQLTRQIADYLTLTVVNISVILDPEAIIFGGDQTDLAEIWIEEILKRIPAITPYTPRLMKSSLGDLAGMMGAIQLVLNSTCDYVTVQHF